MANRQHRCVNHPDREGYVRTFPDKGKGQGYADPYLCDACLDLHISETLSLIAAMKRERTSQSVNRLLSSDRE